MILDLDTLLRRGQAPARFHLEREGWPGESIDPSVTIIKTVVEGTVSADGSLLTVQGALRFDYETQCARCLASVSSCQEAEFTEEFARSASDDAPDRYLYVGHTLDLTQMVEDCIALNMPLRTLCSEDCKGLCPVCGANRNTISCGCSSVGEGPKKNPFAVLAAKLREENEEV
ncbi:MAG: YceD family protein [Christensenellaceae bacterium]